MKRNQIFILLGAILFVVLIAVGLLPKNEKKEKEIFIKLSTKEAEIAFDNGELIKSKQLYQKAIEEEQDLENLKKMQKAIQDINMEIIFSSCIDECSKMYVVKPNDFLGRIAKRFGTTVGLIKKSNGLKSDIIRPGQKLKISICKFSILVDKSQNLLFLKSNEEILKTYLVSTGKDNTTPIGTFKINRNKLKNPTWHKTGAIIPPDSPDNILGSRWMGISGIDSNGAEIVGYGIHGTTKPKELGQQVTLGCVRMENKDVEELFDIIPIGAEVVIID